MWLENCLRRKYEVSRSELRIIVNRPQGLFVNDPRKGFTICHVLVPDVTIEWVFRMKRKYQLNGSIRVV